MRPFEYVSPKTRAQAFSLLGPSWGQSEVLAGGTDLLALMKDDVVRPKRLVNIKSIEGLRNSLTVGLQGSPMGGGATIGALVTLGDLAESLKLRNAFMKDYPAFAEAVSEAASPQIRSLATLGGNLCQRPRCWYFRNGFGLLPQDETGKDLVAAGENRYHAILGNEGRAKFVSPSTIVPILIAYNAKIQIAGPKGKRELPLEKFYVIPKSDDEREHDLHPNEIVSAVVLPSSQGVKAAHYEIRQKAAFDWPLAVAAVALKMDGETVSAARVVLGYVAPVPWISPEAEQALVGKRLSEETAKTAADAALKNAAPLSHNAYKVQLAKVALKRAILKAGGTA
jgi:xanthine dehydrogenase YagS FAD-binding subunit